MCTDIQCDILRQNFTASASVRSSTDCLVWAVDGFSTTFIFRFRFRLGICVRVFVVGGRRLQPPTSRGLGHRPPAASEQKIECATTRTHDRRTYEWQWFDFGLDICGFWILRVRVRVWFLNYGFWVWAPKYRVRFQVWFFTREYPINNRLK